MKNLILITLIGLISYTHSYATRSTPKSDFFAAIDLGRPVNFTVLINRYIIHVKGEVHRNNKGQLCFTGSLTISGESGGVGIVIPCSEVVIDSQNSIQTPPITGDLEIDTVLGSTELGNSIYNEIVANYPDL